MPNVTKEVLDLIKAVTIQSEQLDNLRNETQGLVELRIQVALHEKILSGRTKLWDWILTVVGLVIAALVGGIAGVVATRFFPPS